MACTSHRTTSTTSTLESELTLTHELQNTIDDSLKNSGVQGVSSAIIKPNKEICLGVSGMSDPTMDYKLYT